MKSYIKTLKKEIKELYNEVKINYQYNINWYKQSNIDNMVLITKKEQKQFKRLLEKYGNFVIKKNMVTLLKYDKFTVTIKRTK